MDCFKVFSYNKVITFIQSPNLVYRIFTEIFSFVIKIANDVNKAEELAMGNPILGLTNYKVLDVNAGPDPIK